MVSQDRVRLGSVSFLNAWPLIWGIAPDDPLIDLDFQVPSVLADGLRQGRYDVALIPIVEYFRHEGYVILPDMAVASAGSVRSVCLFSKCPIPEIRSVGLDTNSRTSRALVQILLAEQYHLSPVYRSSRPGVHPAAAETDATLIIGDRTLQLLRQNDLVVLDLGESWWDFTGLPFVYACWVARRDKVGDRLPAIVERLTAAKRAGVAQREQVARKAAVELGLPFEVCLQYLQENVKHDLGEAERAGLQLFYRYAVKHRLVPEGLSTLFWMPA